jgi:hypothetical protein
MKSQLQPLSVSVNKPFKYLVHKLYDAWLKKDNHMLTPSGKTKSASSVIVVGMSKAWKDVPVIFIPKLF